MQAIVKCSSLYSISGGQHKHWHSVLWRSIDWCKQLWDVRCCSQYVVVSISIREVFNVAVSSGASNGGVFGVVFGMWRYA